jgi:hypothetical protein
MHSLILGAESLPMGDDGITSPTFLNDDLLHVPEAIDIIP